MSKAKDKTVTYLGPVDAADPTAVYRQPVDGGEDLVLTKGIPKHDVPADVFKALKDTEGHRFAEGEVEIADPAAGAPWPDYPQLSADDVIVRIGDPQSTPSADVARAVAAWEADHDARSSVVEAAEAQVVAFDPASAEAADGKTDGAKKGNG